jgi:hypothetical protein
MAIFYQFASVWKAVVADVFYGSDLELTVADWLNNLSAMSGGSVNSQNSRYPSAENPRCHYMMLKLVCGVLWVQLGVLRRFSFEP